MLQLILNRGKAVAACATLVLVGAAIGRAQQDSTESPFASTTVDVGLCVSDVEKSVKFYTEVLGFRELAAFDAPAQFLTDVGLTKELGAHIQVVALGDGPTATKIKLMQFKTAPGARQDQSYLHSTYGIRYFTISVKDVNASVKHATEHGGKLVAKSPQPLPEGFPAGLGLANFRDPDGNIVELVGPYKK